MGEKTILYKNRSDSNSLRSTVPHSIVQLLKLNDGEKIEWVVEIENNNPIAIVKPYRGEDNE